MRIQEMFMHPNWNRSVEAEDGFDIAVGRLQRPVKNATCPQLVSKDQNRHPNAHFYALGWGWSMDVLRIMELIVVKSELCPRKPKDYMKADMICAYPMNERKENVVEHKRDFHWIMKKKVDWCRFYEQTFMWTNVLQWLWIGLFFFSHFINKAHRILCYDAIMLMVFLCIWTGDYGGPLLLPDQRDEGDTRNDRIVGITSFPETHDREDRGSVFTELKNFLPWIHSITLTRSCKSQVLTTKIISFLVSLQNIKTCAQPPEFLSHLEVCNKYIA